MHCIHLIKSKFFFFAFIGGLMLPNIPLSAQVLPDSVVIAFSNHTFLVEKGKQLGFLNEKSEFTPIDYSAGGSHWKKQFPYIILTKNIKDGEPYRVERPNKYMLVHVETGKKYIYDDININYDYPEANTCITVKDGKYGVLSDTGVLVQNTYADIRQLDNTNFIAINTDSVATFFTPTFKKIGEMPKISAFNKVIRGVNRFKITNDLYGIFDDNGKILLPTQYVDISRFNKDLLVIQDIDNQKGIATREGKFVIALSNYWDITDFKSIIDRRDKDYFLVNKEGKWAIFDSLGKKLSGFVYDEMRPYFGTMFFFRQNDLWGIAKAANNQILVAPKWKGLTQILCDYNIYDGIIYKIETDNDVDIYIDNKGNEVIKNPCDLLSVGQKPTPTVRYVPPVSAPDRN